MSIKPQTLDLGTRVELVSMDAHCRDITIALYRQEHDGRPEYLVHSYSRADGARERIGFLRTALATLADFHQAGDWLYFPCGKPHQLAARRAFLEACKLPSTAEPAAKPLSVFEKKSALTIVAEPLDKGRYRITAEGPEDARVTRIDSVAAGLRKLGELALIDESSNQIAFECGHAHDAVIGVLLPRALNVRMTLREEEAAAARGLLVAPSQQN